MAPAVLLIIRRGRCRGPGWDGFDLLDSLIGKAWADLRVARAGAARTGNRTNLDALTRAEERLNALLEYRHAALRRRLPMPGEEGPVPPVLDRCSPSPWRPARTRGPARRA